MDKAREADGSRTSRRDNDPGGISAGLRAAGACNLRWDQADFDAAVLHVRRIKNGTPEHPSGDRRRTPGPAPAPARKPAVALRLRQRAGIPVHDRRLCPDGSSARPPAGASISRRTRTCCDACGYALANKGHDTRAIQLWLGHRSITSTAVYTALAPNRFKELIVRRRHGTELSASVFPLISVGGCSPCVWRTARDRGLKMRAYLIYSLEDWHIHNPPAVVECQDDETAIERARQLVDGRPLEVWESSRLIARLDPGPNQ
jgi:hypothetical protein